jgi:hypothetical protein
MKLGGKVNVMIEYYITHELKYVLHNHEEVNNLKFNFIMRDVYDNTYRLIRNIYVL